MDVTTEKRLRELEDRERIRELRAAYCFLVDDRSFSELAENCFTDDACVEFCAVGGELEPVIAKGRSELLAFFTEIVGNLFSSMTHTVHNHRIVVDGDGASGDCYFEFTGCEAATGADLVGAGRYLDRYRRTAKGWRFSERRAEILYMAPLAEGWSKHPFIKSLKGGR